MSSTNAALMGAGEKVAAAFAELLRDLSAADIPSAMKARLAERFAAVLFANSNAHFFQAERLRLFAQAVEASMLSLPNSTEDHNV